MKSHEIAEQIALGFAARDLNEANTRHQLIDPLLHDVLGWPRNRVLCEEFIQPGFADYMLIRGDETPLLFIEAKKEGLYYELPTSLVASSQSVYVKMKTLLTDEAVRSAVLQVRDYCLNRGCEFAAVTNGHQWIFFKPFQTGHDWREIRAFVINGLGYFSTRFIEAHNNFSYKAIVEDAALRRLFLDSRDANRELFYPKNRIMVYDAPVDANGYASSLRPIADKYFGAIDGSDSGFMESCYVSDRDYDLAFINAKRRLEDAVTPFLEQFNVREFRDNKRGGGFGNRISKNVVGLRPADVVVLFGGKGVGKSTFLRRLFNHTPPQVIAKKGVVVTVDLLTATHDKAAVQSAIWSELASQLDGEGQLKADRQALCALFSDRFEQAKSQELFGLDERSESYNLRLNQLVAEWKLDFPYITKCWVFVKSCG